MKIKKLMPLDAESRRLIDWMEKGPYSRSLIISVLIWLLKYWFLIFSLSNFSYRCVRCAPEEVPEDAFVLRV